MRDRHDHPKAEDPGVAIARLFAERSTRSDSEVLAELEAFEPLPEESSVEWSSDSAGAWIRARLFVALADAAAVRKLRGAAPMLLERACFGDPGEMMRGLRHSLEAIFKPDWAALTKVCVDASSSKTAGARLWAVDELGVLRSPESTWSLIARLEDEQPEIRSYAARAVVRLCDAHPSLAESVVTGLKRASSRFRDAALTEALAKLNQSATAK